MLPVLSPWGSPRWQLPGRRLQADLGNLLEVRLNGQRVRYLPNLNGEQQAQLWRDYCQYVNGYRGAPVVFKRLLKANIPKIWHSHERLWKCLMTNIVLAFPELSATVQRYAVKWWTIMTRMILENDGRTVPFTRFWKGYVNDLRRFYLRGLSYRGGNPSGRSPYPVSPLGTWMDKLPGELDKAELSYLLMLCTSRSFPPGDKLAEEEALIKHELCYTTVPEPLDEDLKIRIRRYALVAGAEIGMCARVTGAFRKADAHCSVSNSSSFERTREEGGRRGEILHQLKQWATSPWPSSTTVILPWNTRVQTVQGQPRWFAYDPPEDSKAEFGAVIPGKGTLYPKRYGMSRDSLGHMAMHWAYDSLLSKGYINPSGLPTGKPWLADTTSVPEPGAKVRIPTIAEADVVTYLQPSAHILKSIMESDPSLRAGFGAAAQAYEYLKRQKGLVIHEGFGMLLGDFEVATDNMEHEVSRIIIDGFCEGAGITNLYIKGCLYLITQPFIMNGEILTVRGVPMGMPGTKPLLHLTGKVMSLMARGVEAPRDFKEISRTPFSNAGDDVIDIGKVDTMKRYRRMAEILRMKPSPDKWDVYLVGGPYCECMLRLHSNWAANATEDTAAFIDSIRVRLLSCESKPTKGDETRNPVFGKAHQFSKEIRWVPDYYPNLRLRAVTLFQWNFSYYLRGEEGKVVYNTYLPRWAGGLGLPLPPDKIQDFVQNVPTWHVNAISQVIRNPDPAVRRRYARLLSSWGSSVISTRGFESFEGDNPLVETLAEFLPIVNLEQALACIEGDQSQITRYWDKLQLAFKNQYIDLDSLQLNLPDLWFEEVKTIRGWPNRTFEERNRLIQSVTEPLNLESYDFKWTEVLDPDFEVKLPVRLVHKDYCVVGNLDEGIFQAMQLDLKDRPASVYLDLPNDLVLRVESESSMRLWPTPIRTNALG